MRTGQKPSSPLISCPVPVTRDNYLVDSRIELDPRFIAAENGYIYEATNACNCSWSPNITDKSGHQWASFNFNLYGNQKVYPCGPQQYWAYSRPGILLVTMPINSTGGLQFSDSEIQWVSGAYIAGCTTTQTTS